MKIWWFNIDDENEYNQIKNKIIKINAICSVIIGIIFFPSIFKPNTDLLRILLYFPFGPYMFVFGATLLKIKNNYKKEKIRTEVNAEITSNKIKRNILDFSILTAIFSVV